jgi:AraC-like DNA-binding protein
VNEFRISVACKKLLLDDFSISEICYEVGFTNLSNFNRQFKKITGFTPSQYVGKHGM